MLEDRDYMRQPDFEEPRWTPRFHPRLSWTLLLLVIYAIVFVTELVMKKYFPDHDFFSYLALSTDGLKQGFVWQLVTYQFMHAGWMHLLLNSWVIFMFGREIEGNLGGKKFLALMFSSGIVGGVFQMIVALVWPKYFGGPVVGASACAFGLVAAFALLFPERELTMLLLFVIPVHMRAKTLLIGSAVLAVAGFAFHDFIMPGVAHAAHLGGMAMGWFYVRKILQGDWSRLTGALPSEKNTLSRRPKPETFEVGSAANFLESEVDPILDKISAHGMKSLTPREREILETARKHIKRS